MHAGLGTDTSQDTIYGGIPYTGDCSSPIRLDVTNASYMLIHFHPMPKCANRININTNNKLLIIDKTATNNRPFAIVGH